MVEVRKLKDKATIKKAGYKITGPRQLVLDFLKSGEHYTAKEIYEGLEKTLGLTTVYRTLEILTELGIVETIALTDGSLRYEYVLGKKHHHHLVCTGCGDICELDGCAIKDLEENVAKQTAYVISGHALELYGLCPRCQKK